MAVAHAKGLKELHRGVIDRVLGGRCLELIISEQDSPVTPEPELAGDIHQTVAQEENDEHETVHVRQSHHRRHDSLPISHYSNIIVNFVYFSLSLSSCSWKGFEEMMVEGGGGGHY